MEKINNNPNKHELLNMNLHDEMVINNNQYHVTIVMGGWIYCRQEPTVNIANPVFVPFTPKL